MCRAGAPGLSLAQLRKVAEDAGVVFAAELLGKLVGLRGSPRACSEVTVSPTDSESCQHDAESWLC